MELILDPRGKMRQRPKRFKIRRPKDHYLAQGLVLFIGGNEPSTVKAFDSSIYNNHGILTNMDPATDWVWSKELNRFVLDFDGTDDYVIGSGIPAIEINTCSISFLMYSLDYSRTNQRFNGIIRLEDAAGGLVMRMYIADEVDNCVVSVWSNGAVAGSAVNTLVNGNVHRIVCLPATVKTSHLLYIDGKETTYRYTETGSGTPNPPVGEYKIGDSESGQRYWYGFLTDVMIHNRRLSEAEIQILSDHTNVALGGLIYAERELWPVLLPSGAEYQASISALNISVSESPVTASSIAEYQASISALNISVSESPITASSIAEYQASISALNIFVSESPVTAEYTIGYQASISALNIFVSESPITASSIAEYQASISALNISVSESPVTAEYIIGTITAEIESVTITVVINSISAYTMINIEGIEFKIPNMSYDFQVPDDRPCLKVNEEI